MIRSKQGKIKHSTPSKVQENLQVGHKQFDAVLKNYKCLFCHTRYYFEDIYSAKCSCGSQWFEKLSAIMARQIKCV